MPRKGVKQGSKTKKNGSILKLGMTLADADSLFNVFNSSSIIRKKEAYTRHDCIKRPYESHNIEQWFEKMQFLQLTFFWFSHIGYAMINPGLI